MEGKQRKQSYWAKNGGTWLRAGYLGYNLTFEFGEKGCNVTTVWSLQNWSKKYWKEILQKRLHPNSSAEIAILCQNIKIIASAYFFCKSFFWSVVKWQIWGLLHRQACYSKCWDRTCCWHHCFSASVQRLIVFRKATSHPSEFLSSVKNYEYWKQ